MAEMEVIIIAVVVIAAVDEMIMAHSNLEEAETKAAMANNLEEVETKADMEEAEGEVMVMVNKVVEVEVEMHKVIQIREEDRVVMTKVVGDEVITEGDKHPKQNQVVMNSRAMEVVSKAVTVVANNHNSIRNTELS